MKKDILILAALIAVVIAVPFLATKAEEAIQIKNEEFKEKQNRECHFWVYSIIYKFIYYTIGG